MRVFIRPVAVGAMALGLFASVGHAQNPLGQREPAAGGGNPLAPRPAVQKPFAGTFVGDKISLELNYDERQEAYTGWLTFNGNRFACGGFVENSQLAGKFVANGQQYPFSLGINGDGATLTSEGQNYQLKKQGGAQPPANPLAGGNNPLGGGGPPINPQPGPGPQPQPGPGVPAGVGGVGIAFRQNNDGDWIVEQIRPGSPAAKAGLKPGGSLVAVDGKSVENLNLDQVRQLVTGRIGTQVKLTIETTDEVMDVLLIRADLGGGPPPGQNPQPGPGPQPGPVPGPNPGPVGPGGQLPPNFPGQPQNNGQAAAWVKPGVRLTFWSGSATISGAATVLVPDDEGNWKTPDGRKYSAQENPGAGGAGYMQLTIASVNNGQAVVDARNFLINPENQAVTSINSTGYVVPAGQGGEYWGDPRAMAQLQAGNQGSGVRIFKGPYTLGQKQYNVVRVTTQTQTGYTQYTYDLDTGIMVSMGSCSVGQSQMIPGAAGGQSTVGGASTYITQGFFVGMRDVNLPWIGQRGSRELANLRQIEFGGTYNSAVANAGEVNWGFGLRWDINKIDEWSVSMKQSSMIDYKNGAQPQPDVSDRAGSLAMLWIDPQILGRMQQGQVIDEDPFTKKRTTVMGIQNGSLAIGEQGATENSVSYYDQRSGMLNAYQMQNQNGLGKTTISLQRTK